ncbi:uncharacterized protein BYT42DRAFT_587390 [Radiomyces spectabilis]|uniref:uncharacterized protein n=1 Tax=Radiomyces spectabilis TaxID=64574 RepID=UPI00221EFA2B|nr:uncharacterized protein BYT42DRAFT_587390 [Radiomyces spectabilis]KAI8366651.1 hypothetical protein BYT42DRAFT_587390 [Radiomyces spectabilis]
MHIAAALTCFVSALLVSVQAAPAAPAAPAACLGFRITSPTKSGLNWTYGQCYSVDWDLGASQVKTITSVDLYDAATKKKVTTEVSNISASKGTTGNFPLMMGDDVESGNYYFVLNGKAGNGQACQLSSVSFHVTVNPNSPPATC